MTEFPLKTMLAAAAFVAILLGVHYGVNRSKGFDLAAARPITQFRFDRASVVPVVKMPVPPVPRWITFMLHCVGCETERASGRCGSFTMAIRLRLRT
jgi:hypothetical protein